MSVTSLIPPTTGAVLLAGLVAALVAKIALIRSRNKKEQAEDA